MAFPAVAAEAFVLFLDEKNQKSIQPEGFFAAHGLYPAKQVKPRAVIFCPLTLSQPSAKFTMPLPPHRPCLFSLLSPEAYLLTFGDRTRIFLIDEKSKRSAMACEGARPGVLPRAVAAISLA